MTQGDGAKRRWALLALIKKVVMNRIISPTPHLSPEMPDARVELSPRLRRSALIAVAAACALWLLVVVLTGSLLHRPLRDGSAGAMRLTQAVLDGVPVSLPHRPDRQLASPRWMDFRLQLRIRDAGGPDIPPMGLCVARWSLTAEVSIDGQMLAGAATGRQVGAQYLNHHVVALPPGLAPGIHELSIRVLAWPGMDPGLSEVWVGDHDEIKRACQQSTQLRWLPGYGAQLILTVVGLVALWLYAVTRERLVLWFIATAVTWVFHGRHFLYADLPLDIDGWILVFLGTRELFVVPLMCFAYEMAQRDARRLGAVLAGLYLAAVGTLAVLPAAHRSTWLIAMTVLAAAGLAWSLVIVLRAQRFGRSVALPALAMALAALLASTVHDAARWGGLTEYRSHSLSYALSLLLAFSFVVLLVERLLLHFAHDAQSLEWMRAEVEHQRALIAQDFERLRQQRERLLAATERRRMVQDLHDVLGSQLLSASVLLKDSARSGGSDNTSQASHLVERALMDLRGALDVLSLEESDDPDDDPVATLLGTMRRRLAAVFEAAGMTLRWTCDPLPAHFLARTAHRIELVRLLHEALANVLKHSKAREVHVSVVAPDRQAVEISVRDDGAGFDGATAQGIGLPSMRQRARVIGAQLWIESRPGEGTQVVLRWSLA